MKINGIEVGVDDFFTTEETARILKRAKATLDRNRHEKRGLPYTRIGKRIFYRGGDIIDKLNENRVDF